mgnify:CR=1 FL=1
MIVICIILIFIGFVAGCLLTLLAVRMNHTDGTLYVQMNEKGTGITDMKIVLNFMPKKGFVYGKRLIKLDIDTAAPLE